MKLETAVIGTKGLCYIVIGGLGPLVSGLGQWIDTGEWPPTLNWVVIVAGCFIGAATQMLSFLSSSFGNYLKSQSNGNGNGNGTPAPVAKP